MLYIKIKILIFGGMKIVERIKEFIKQKACSHKEFEQDIQIRTLQCKNCGMRSRLSDYVDLYKKI